MGIKDGRGAGMGEREKLLIHYTRTRDGGEQGVITAPACMKSHCIS